MTKEICSCILHPELESGHQGEDVSEDAVYLPELIEVDKGKKIVEGGRKSTVYNRKQWKDKCKINTKAGETPWSVLADEMLSLSDSSQPAWLALPRKQEPSPSACPSGQANACVSVSYSPHLACGPPT